MERVSVSAYTFVWLVFSQLLLLVGGKDESQRWAFLSTDWEERRQATSNWKKENNQEWPFQGGIPTAASVWGKYRNIDS